MDLSYLVFMELHLFFQFEKTKKRKIRFFWFFSGLIRNEESLIHLINDKLILKLLVVGKSKKKKKAEKIK